VLVGELTERAEEPVAYTLSPIVPALAGTAS
jgi:hypothetical protein